MLTADKAFNFQSRARTALLLAACTLGLICALPIAATAQSTRNDLNRVRQQIERELRSRPEMLEARTELLEARREFNVLRSIVVNELGRNSHYLGIRAEMWRAEDELEALARYYRNGIIPADQVHRLARQILELRTQLTRMEYDALKRNSEALAAQEAYRSAGRRLIELNREIRDRVRADPRFQRALDRLRSGSRGGAGGATGAGGGVGRPRP